MRTEIFIEQVQDLGYECIVGSEQINIYRLYGDKLRDRMRVSTIILSAPYQFKMTLDPADVTAGLGELILEYGASSMRQRGRLQKYSYRDRYDW